MSSQLRRELLVRTTMEVLLERDAPMPAADIIDTVAKRMELTDHELSLNASGVARFDTYIRFASLWMSVVGWITKSRAGWQVTSEGREAFERYPAQQFLIELTRRYRQAHRSRGTTGEGWTDPRWHTVREAITAVPEGSWTAYKDLSDLSGVPARTIGTFLSSNDVPGAHRVLTVEGTIAQDFRWHDTTNTQDPRTILEAEGLEFDGTGRADPERRITAEDLREVVGTPATGTRAWLVRGSAVAGMNVVGQWLADGFVSVAASHLRPVEPGIGLDDLRAAVEVDYEHLPYNQRQAKLAELHAFLNRMTTGDALATTSEGQVFVGRIEGDATFDGAADTRTTIRREVAWQPDGIDFAELPDDLQARLKSSSTVLDLTDVSELVEELLAEVPAAEVAAPVRDVTLPHLPEDVVQRLLVGEAWLADFVDLLRSRRQVVLYGPPGTGKTFLALAVSEALTAPENVTLVQFHPAYSYEDFFEGYRPSEVAADGRVGFRLTPGPFRKLVERARENPGQAFVLIIDEMNRANLAKVFGELYFLLEYRNRTIDLTYSSGDARQAGFTLPRNVYLIGTMNTADRSIALVDAAIRRRFAFLSLHPQDGHLRDVLRRWLAREGLPPRAADLLEELNRRIPDRDFMIGPSYLMNTDAATDVGLARIWATGILPLLEEYHIADGVDVPQRYGLAALDRALGRALGAASSGDASA